LAVKERVLEPGHADIAYTLNNIALYLDGLGDTAQAVVELARAVQIVENGLGADHPRTASMLSNYSELLNRLGRFADAGQAATRALAVLEREADPDGLYITYPLVSLGITYLGLDQSDRAVPILERAHAIREVKEPIAAKRAEARFALARALARQGQDPARALSLARTAGDEYRQSPMTPDLARELGALEAWIASQSPPN
jgi:tetratricopeptide (TPR) repeat protein